MRLVRITGVDLSLFEFDYDLTWFGFFLSADEVVYGRYGGRDAKSDEGRLSLAGLKYAMEKALERHKAGIKSPPARGTPIKAEDLKAAATRRGNECIHCHQVNEFRRSDEKAAGTWSRDSLWVYPLPENVGITLEVDRGDVVKAVAAGLGGREGGAQARRCAGHGERTLGRVVRGRAVRPAQGAEERDDRGRVAARDGPDGGRT